MRLEIFRIFNRKDGSVGKYFTFNIEDSQTCIRVVVWTGTEIKDDTGFTKNEIIRVVNGNVKVGKTGGLELHVGNKSRIQIHPDDIDRAIFENKKPDQKSFTPINAINLNQQVLNIKGIIGTVFPPKEYKKKTGELGKRASLLLKEGADSISITFWDQNANLVNNLKMGDIVEIYDVFPKKGFRDTTKIDLTANSSTKIEVKSHQAIDTINSIFSNKKFT